MVIIDAEDLRQNSFVKIGWKTRRVLVMNKEIQSNKIGVVLVKDPLMLKLGTTICNKMYTVDR